MPTGFEPAVVEAFDRAGIVEDGELLFVQTTLGDGVMLGGQLRRE